MKGAGVRGRSAPGRPGTAGSVRATGGPPIRLVRVSATALGAGADGSATRWNPARKSRITTSRKIASPNIRPPAHPSPAPLALPEAGLPIFARGRLGEGELRPALPRAGFPAGPQSLRDLHHIHDRRAERPPDRPCDRLRTAVPRDRRAL